MMAEWPDWLPGLIIVPDDQYLAGQLPLLAVPAAGIVIHSGDTAANVAEFISKNRYSYHAAWHSKLNQIVQMVPLTHRAQHAGSAGNHWLSIALSGPDEQDPRSEYEKSEFQRVLKIFVTACTSLEFWCRHSDIKSTKRDPGPGFTGDWMAVTGLLWKPANRT